MQNTLTQFGRPPQRRCFTIVEMIIVLGVTVIIVGMSFGIMGSLNTRKGAEGGARIVSRQLFLCRDYAIMHRQRVALILPLGNVGGGAETDANFKNRHGNVAGSDGSDHFAHAVRPCIVDRNQVFQAWVPNTAWEFLPNRVHLEASGLPQVTGDFGVGAGAYTISGIIFKPNGSLTVNSDIGIGGTLMVTDGGDQTYNIRVNWLTGKAAFVE